MSVGPPGGPPQGDGRRLPERPLWLSLRGMLLILLGLALYGFSLRITEVDLFDLVTGWSHTRPILADLLQPSLFTRPEQSQKLAAPIEVGQCSAEVTPVEVAQEGRDVRLDRGCVASGGSVAISGSGFRPDSRGFIRWLLPNGNTFTVTQFRTDVEGSFGTEIVVSPFVTGTPGSYHLRAEVLWRAGGLQPSDALSRTVEKIIETVFLALMATTLATFFAVPASFVAARNIMGRSRWGRAIYYAMRTLLNGLRSIEPLILGVVFFVWVGLGPFAGVLALTVASIANLGKLFSEAVEGIDPGPIEAITATGAGRLQVITFAVIPQIVPPYIGFLLYQWDINVRLSTIIGFVGGGGIGFLLQEYINLLQYQKAATAMWAIALVVSVMDYASAVVRKRYV